MLMDISNINNTLNAARLGSAIVFSLVPLVKLYRTFRAGQLVLVVNNHKTVTFHKKTKKKLLATKHSCQQGEIGICNTDKNFKFIGTVFVFYQFSNCLVPT